MLIFVFSDNKKTEDIFSALNKLKNNSIIFHPVKSLNKMISKIEKKSFIYLDAGKLTAAELKKNINILSKLDNIYYGIIDPKGTVKDVADLFRNRASDYIGKEQSKVKIPAKRVNSIIEYLKHMHGEDAGTPDDSIVIDNFISSGKDWKDIRPGKEYSFCFMFIELDNQGELKGKYGDINTGEFVYEFRQLVSDKFSSINGKVWMWMDFGGLILFPFDGETCVPLLECFKFYMDLKIITAENFSYDDQLSFRVALHIGNTEYKERGYTGEIISDSVNSIFHLGQKFAKPGAFVLTENIFRFIPKGIKDYFVDEGSFEGRKIKRMKRLL